LKTLAAVAALSLTLAVTDVQAKSSHGWLWRAFQCIHKYEGPWNANTGNGYYGGLQMDKNFMLAYGRWAVRRWGWAHNWPPSVQIRVAIHAYRSGRGFGPWPTTRHYCGL
jgi:hypothetical protein